VDSGDPTAEMAASSRFLSARRLDGRHILSAAGFALLDNRVAQIGEPAGQHQSSTVDIEASDARNTNGALLDSILLEAGAAGRSGNSSHRQSTIFPASRS
jgi:hypothetical protein